MAVTVGDVVLYVSDKGGTCPATVQTVKENNRLDIVTFPVGRAPIPRCGVRKRNENTDKDVWYERTPAPFLPNIHQKE